MNTSSPLTFIDFPRPDSVPIPVDASLLKQSHCETAWDLTLQGIRPALKDPILTVGTSVHTFAARRHTVGDLAAMAEGAAQYATVEKDTTKFAAICSAMPRGLLPPPLSEPHGAELYFEVPWLEFLRDGLPHHVLLCGTMDHLSFDASGVVRIFDYKTTRKYKLEEAFASYANDVQFLFYRWVIWKFGHRFLPREVSNAARELKLTSAPVIIQLGSKSQPARWSVGPAENARIVEFERFEEELKAKLEHLLIKAPADARSGWLSNQCPRCRYNKICHALPGMESAVLERFYVRKNYEPKNHT